MIRAFAPAEEGFIARTQHCQRELTILWERHIVDKPLQAKSKGIHAIEGLAISFEDSDVSYCSGSNSLRVSARLLVCVEVFLG